MTKEENSNNPSLIQRASSQRSQTNYRQQLNKQLKVMMEIAEEEGEDSDKGDRQKEGSPERNKN